jgi:hypothetical protein
LQHNFHAPVLTLIDISDTSDTTTRSSVSRQRGHRVSHWRGEERSKSGSPIIQSSPPQSLSRTRIYPQGSNVSDLSATPPSSSGSLQRLGLTPLVLDHQRPMLTSLEPPPRRRPVSTRSDSLPRRRPEPSGTPGISSPFWNGQTTQAPSVRPSSNHSLSQMHFPDSRQAHPLSPELPASPSPRRSDVQVTRLTSSIPPTPGRLLDMRGLHPRLAAITPRDSNLTRDRKSKLQPHFQMTQPERSAHRIPLCSFQNHTRQMVSWRVTIHPAREPTHPGTTVGNGSQTWNDQVKSLVYCFPRHTHWDI